jgi:hypothetical protein
VYAITVPSQDPELGALLLSAGALTPESLAEAVKVRRTELPSWRLSELLVQMGYVDQDRVEAAVGEQVSAGCAELLGWTTGP